MSAAVHEVLAPLTPFTPYTPYTPPPTIALTPPLTPPLYTPPARPTLPFTLPLPPHYVPRRMRPPRPVHHVVAYRLAPSGDPQALVRAATSLPDTARLNGAPYIRRVTGGKQNSPLAMADGMHVVFVLEFACEADRDYWVFTDPAYKAFKERVEARVGVESKLVLDFTEGQY